MSTADMLTPARVCLLLALCLVASLPGFLGVQLPAINEGAKESFSKVVIDADGSVDQQKKKEDGVRRRRRGVALGSVNVDYGGRSHLDRDPAQLQSNGLPEVWRPEAVQSSRCDDTACHMCSHKTDDGCWQGGDKGDMMLAVQAGSDFKSFAQEVFFKCSKDGGKFLLRVRTVNNGKINVYANHNLVDKNEKTGWKGTIDAQNLHGKNGGATNFKFRFGGANVKGDTLVTDAATARIRVVFFPIDPNSPSSAEMKIEAYAVSPTVDKCMSIQQGMSVLGDGSDEGFQIRNDNRIAHQCLESDTHAFSGPLQAMCSAWKAKLSQETKSILKTLLKAAGVGSASFADEASTVGGNLTVSNDPNECLNPAVDDTESWNCECVDYMVDSCGGDDEACFKGIMCDSAEVCQSWKDAVQCGDSNGALAQRSRTGAASGIDNALDASVQGKCSQ